MKRKCKRNFRRSEGLRISNLAKTNPKSFWKNIKKQNKKNNAISEKLDIKDMFNHFNGLLGSEPAQEDINHANGPPLIDDENLDSEFTEAELKHAVFSQNNSKSPGNDQLIAEVFKTSFDMISTFLLSFYNKIFSPEYLP